MHHTILECWTFVSFSCKVMVMYQRLFQSIMNEIYPCQVNMLHSNIIIQLKYLTLFLPFDKISFNLQVWFEIFLFCTITWEDLFCVLPQDNSFILLKSQAWYVHIWLPWYVIISYTIFIHTIGHLMPMWDVYFLFLMWYAMPSFWDNPRLWPPYEPIYIQDECLV